MDVSVPAQSVHIPTPAIGDVVSFSYDHYSRRRDLPVNPVIYRVRHDHDDREDHHDGDDVSWVPSMAISHLSTTTTTHTSTMHTAKTTPVTGMQIMFYFVFYFYIFIYLLLVYFCILQPLTLQSGIGTGASTGTPWQHIENRRLFFERYAQTHRFDPLCARNWYQHPTEQIMATKV